MFYWFLNNYVWFIPSILIVGIIFRKLTYFHYSDTQSTIDTYTKIMWTKNKKGYIIEL